MMHTTQRGFTLIELMIVVTVIGILAAIAIPTYTAYSIETAENSCFIQTKSYSNAYKVAVDSGKTGTDIPSVPNGGACDGITSNNGTNITATPQSPGVKNTTCVISTGICSLS